MSKPKHGSWKPTLESFSDAVSSVLQELVNETEEDIENGLNAGTNYLIDKLIDATPVDTGIEKQSWGIDNDPKHKRIAVGKYKHVRYINNFTVNKDGIPITNLNEFAPQGHPFVRATINKEKEQVLNIIIKEATNGKGR